MSNTETVFPKTHVPLGISLERSLVDQLRAAGCDLHTNPVLDREWKADAVIFAVRGRKLPRPVFLQYTTIPGYACKMETFLRIREARRQSGIYLEAPHTNIHRSTKVVLDLAGGPLAEEVEEPVVLHANPDQPGPGVLKDVIAKLSRAFNDPTQEHRRRTGFVVGTDCSRLHLALVLDNADAIERPCQFRTCADYALHQYLVYARFEPRAVRWQVPVSFVPPSTEHPYGYGIRFADPAYGRWLTRFLREEHLIFDRFRWSNDAPPEIKRAHAATGLVIFDLIMEGLQRGYHLPQTYERWW